MENRTYNVGSKVEAFFEKQFKNSKVNKTDEKIKTIEVDNYINLGQLTALRFLEWVALNPGGVVALPTGKTPEFFIKWMQYYLENWDTEINNGLLHKIGFDKELKPDFKSLYFVMIDEFFPLDPLHERSFNYFVKRFYIEGFGFDEKKAIFIDTFNIPESDQAYLDGNKNINEIFPEGFIDLSLRIKHPSNAKEILQKKTIKYFDQFCEDYEEKIRNLGGIGFFLGGIGPDGHIAFDVKGSSHHSHTRLTNINYETQAAAAVDLGGIESVRKKAVITIGLNTITFNPDVVAIIIAAGESKSQLIASAIESEPSLEYPASALQKLENARFYLTKGAAIKLQKRQNMKILESKNPDIKTLDKLIIDGALQENVSLLQLTSENFKSTNQYLLLAQQISGESLAILAQATHKRIVEKIKKGLNPPIQSRILHTAPHHDDIELAYFPLLHHLVRSEHNDNHFVYCTSGFTSVTNDYINGNLKALRDLIVNRKIQKYLDHNRLFEQDGFWDDITGALNAIARKNKEEQDIYISCRLARHLVRWLNVKNINELLPKLNETIHYLSTVDPGKKEIEIAQQIKGWTREFEAELVWAHFGIGLDHVSHLRLQFYTGDIFVEYPDPERDVKPILDLLEKVRPNIVSLALDPEGSGPDTHFKTLIAISNALEKYVEKYQDSDIKIWGYRNIWSKFHISDVSMIVPVSLNSFAVLDNMFNNCFMSQKSASFPSYEYEGPFSDLAQRIWVEQHRQLITLLGREFFYDSQLPLLKRSYGAIYIKEMTYKEFCTEIEFIKDMIDNKKGLKKLN
jgi:glucosamine-6-phosphate deaminase